MQNETNKSNQLGSMERRIILNDFKTQKFCHKVRNILRTQKYVKFLTFSITLSMITWNTTLWDKANESLSYCCCQLRFLA